MKDSDSAKRKVKQVIKRISLSAAKTAIGEAKNLGKIKLYTTVDEDLDEEFHIAVGEQATKLDLSLIYCALVLKNDLIKVIVLAGSEAAKIKGAGSLVKDISKVLGGSGGGTNIFAQGGGKDITRIKDALLLVEQAILEK